MKQLLSYANKTEAIGQALKYARENGESVIVGKIPENIRLVCFDMDNTLVRMETINEIAAAAGIREQMEGLTQQAMSGEADFRTNFMQRVKMLEGVSVATLEQIASTLPYTKGLNSLMDILKQKGIETAVITGNFNIFGEQLKKQFGFDHIYTTTPSVEDGILIGDICGDIIDAPAKSSILVKICSETNIPLNCTIAVGDGANDIPMLSTAGAAIAYNAICTNEGLDEVILPLIP